MTIYSISDLINKNFDDEEIDLVSKSLQYSLVCGMFDFMKIKLSQKEIIDLCKKDEWYNKYEWTEYQRNTFKNKLNKIFYNLYRFGSVKCENSSQEWLMKYGFNIKKQNKKRLNKKKSSN